MKKIAILQSNYLPWKGVFDLMNQVDIFVFEDDVQYTKQDWRNRNKLLTDNGTKWITVPVKYKNVGQLIYETDIVQDGRWQKKHCSMFTTYYSNAPYFKEYRWIIEELYMEKCWTNLSQLNFYCNKLIAKILDIKTQFVHSTDLNIEGKKDDRVLEICKKMNADYYLSGPSAKNYIIPSKFEKEGIILDYIKYEYPKYKQLYEPFNHFVTILDLILNCGPEAPYYIWGWRKDRKKIGYDSI